MSAIAAIYYLVLIAGNTRVEISTAEPLTLERCYQLGEGWARRGQGYRYECRKLPPTTTTINK